MPILYSNGKVRLKNEINFPLDVMTRSQIEPFVILALADRTLTLSKSAIDKIAVPKTIVTELKKNRQSDDGKRKGIWGRQAGLIVPQLSPAFPRTSPPLPCRAVGHMRNIECSIATGAPTP